MKKIIPLLLLLFVNSGFSWNSLGHRLVAQIALDNMNSVERAYFNRLNNLLNKNSRKYTLVNSAIWMDNLYNENLKPLRSFHYIDLPFSKDGSKLVKVDKSNAVFAINMSMLTLQDKNAPDLDKAIAARILWHVVGDIHQPLHSVTLVSKKNPMGDMGGNLVILPKNSVAKNLHAYWDRGAGSFRVKKKYTAKDVKKMARNISDKWPCDKLKYKEYASDNPMKWAFESHKIAINFSYQFSLDKNYQYKAENISKQRIALAGCRLAAKASLINWIYGF